MIVDDTTNSIHGDRRSTHYYAVTTIIRGYMLLFNLQAARIRLIEQFINISG